MNTITKTTLKQEKKEIEPLKTQKINPQTYKIGVNNNTKRKKNKVIPTSTRSKVTIR